MGFWGAKLGLANDVLTMTRRLKTSNITADREVRKVILVLQHQLQIPHTLVVNSIPAQHQPGDAIIVDQRAAQNFAALGTYSVRRKVDMLQHLVVG